MTDIKNPVFFLSPAEIEELDLKLKNEGVLKKKDQFNLIHTVKELSKRSDKYELALRNILKHLEIVAGTANFFSVVSAIARKALEEKPHEISV